MASISFRFPPWTPLSIVSYLFIQLMFMGCLLLLPGLGWWHVLHKEQMGPWYDWNQTLGPLVSSWTQEANGRSSLGQWAVAQHRAGMTASKIIATAPMYWATTLDRCFISIISFTPYNYPMGMLFYRLENQGSEKLITFSKLHRQNLQELGFWTWVCLIF